MDKASAVPVSELPGIDLEFRPPTYFWALALERHLLSRIKGAERNAALKLLLDAGRVNAIPELLARSALNGEERRAWGRIHPDFMGGEYLPDLRQTEVQIARITIASVTQDVTCVYARRSKNRIRYRVVDEYEGDTLSGRNTRSSAHPLTLRELEAFFNGAWSIFDALEMNFGRDGYELDAMLAFVVGVESQFYPQLGVLYARRIKAWAAVQQARLALARAR